jgi:transcriptional regulator with XRE-family HTH domain
MVIADKLKDVRRTKKWTRELLAAYSGISTSTIGRIERGELIPRAGTIIALAHALGVPPKELAAEAGIIIHTPLDKWS